MEEGMQTFPTHWHPFFEKTQLGRHGIENRETHKIVCGTHTGTHIDAPRHFIKNGMTVEKIPIEWLIGPATIVDLKDFGKKQEVNRDTLENRINGRDTKRLLLNFGWDKKLNTMAYYDDCPYLSEEAAEFIVQAGCVLVGLDTPMPDNPKYGFGCPIDSPIHKILLGNDVILCEYMINLSKITTSNCELIILPIKIVGGDGAPVRAIAIERD
tara:strand:+ start:810 stop:1445 length:636 start_codon:yes stop_codon:yes gene_type:complete